jgi:hypothetical protein
MKKILTLVVSLFCLTLSCLADEGMWLPQLLQAINEKQMRKMGMKIKASDIYNISKGSLKDAVVSLGGFCTAEVISDQGLILTNHHCGFDAVQNHSTLDHNYIRDGFWAYEKSQELTNPGLFVTFIISIDDVTEKIMKDVKKGMSEKERKATIDKNIAELKNTYKLQPYEDLMIRPFFEGNKYYLFVTETFKDVRLVGAPPASIGNFGKDTDNWMWPRHTGDFSMFRIYADKNNHPADYSPENVPYVPRKSLTISLKGMKEGDFSMVMGFPGRTNEYLPSSAIEQIMNTSDPAKIGIRRIVLQTMKKYMIADEAVKIKYAAKYASIENAYKKWQGEVLGLNKSNALEKKKSYEADFSKRVTNNVDWTMEYSDLLSSLAKKYDSIKPFAYQRDYFNEIIPRIELFNIAAAVNEAVKENEKKDAAANIDRNKRIIDKLEDIFKEYDPQLDKELFIQLMSKYISDQPESGISPVLESMLKNGNIEALADQLYTSSIMTTLDNIKKILQYAPGECNDIIKHDNLYILYADINNAYAKNVNPTLNKFQSEINQLQRQYMKAQMVVFSEKQFYPDANSTLRVTYGKVKSYQPRDGMKYDFYTYMDGIMEKYIPGDYEFDVPAKLIALYQNKDFGRYGNNGKMPVCLIAANHTTGGNSGSPALNAKGELIGLNFDRVWEGTMSDINYDPSICRNIMVDIRYVLFIVDKFAGAKNLIDEMKISD